jgi:methylmalonyl-CoA carboxyltransferase large subunit
MSSESADWHQIAQALSALREEVSQLGARVAALEAVNPPATPFAPRSPVVVAAEEVGEELLTVLSAAIAAFLGKKPHIRQVRLLGSAAWGMQGRVTIQASHSRVSPLS